MSAELDGSPSSNDGENQPPSSGSEGEQGLELEGRLSRLEAIVTALDSDGIELEDALKLFEEGVGHVRAADDVLSRAELKVEELVGSQGDERREFPTEGGQGGADS